MFKIKFLAGNNPVTISFKTMRRMIGLLGMALPVVMFAWSVLFTRQHFLLDSISSYYHTNLRDVFVGILCSVSFFFFAFHGYDRRDFVAYKIASISALGIAFSPAFIKSVINPYIHIAPNVNSVTNAVHYVFAAIFFGTLAVVSLWLFTRTGKSSDRVKSLLRSEKRNRNRIYRACGIIILLGLVLLAILNALKEGTAILGIDPVFWVETIMLFAFGFSWLVKGDVLFKDKGKPKPVED